MKVSDLVIKFLLSKNIKQVFTVSGGGCIHLIDSLRKEESIKTTCVHHEQSALMASEGYYRQCNNMSANIVTTGPGGTNAITGLLGLWLDGIPSIIISGQVQTSQLSKGTGCRQIGDQEFDIIQSIKNMTKYSITITDKNNILYELQKAYSFALSGRMGPVWIDIPLDIQNSSVDENSLCQYTDIHKNRLVSQEQICKVLDLLSKSKKPLIIAGNGIRLSCSYDLLNEFLLKTKIPIVTGPHSGIDTVDNTYEYYAGRIGILGQQSSNKIVQESDLLIILGTRLGYKMTGYNISEFSPKSTKIIVDIDENEIDKHKFPIDLKIVSDLNYFLNALMNYTILTSITAWQNFVKDIRRTQLYYQNKHKNIKDYVSMYYFMNMAPKYFKKCPVITSDGTAHVVTMQMYNINKGQRVYTNVGCASMGYGLPASIGACIANNMHPVICIEGDGSIMMNLQELQTVRHYELPIKIIIINNDGYLSIKLTQESFFNGNEFASGPNNGVSIPSFSKIAYAFNLPYFYIKNNDDIDSVLNESINYNGPCIIEIFANPKERHEPKVSHKGIDKTGNIIPGTLTDMYISE